MRKVDSTVPMTKPILVGTILIASFVAFVAVTRPPADAYAPAPEKTESEPLSCRDRYIIAVTTWCATSYPFIAPEKTEAIINTCGYYRYAAVRQAMSGPRTAYGLKRAVCKQLEE